MIVNRNAIAQIIFAAIAALLFVYAIRMVAAFPRWLVDDAFILFRYAENLVQTGKLTWNPGENPTEGYTGLTMILLLAPAMKLGISPILAAHVIGIAAFFCGAGLIVLTLRGFNLGSITALALYLTAPFMYAHAWSGLETTLFCAAIVFTLYAYTHRRGKLFISSLLVLSLTRPEGALLSILLLAAYRPFSPILALWYIIPGAIYFFWRFAYYGQLLPNTYYAKSSAGGLWGENLKALRKFASTFLPMPALLALIHVQWEAVKKHMLLIIGVLIFSLVVLYTYVTSELVMTFSYRFYVPFYTITAVALGSIMARARLSFRSAALVLAFIAPWFVHNSKARHLKEYREYCSTYHRMLTDEHIKVGQLINQLLPPEECIIVHSDAGAIPFYSKRKAIDFGGLNDEYLAHQDILSPEIVDYFYSHNAGALVFTSRSNNSLSHGPQANMIEQDPRFGNYTLAQKYRSSARRNYFEFLYVRNDLLEFFPFVEVAEQTTQPQNGEVIASGAADDTIREGVKLLRPDRRSAEELWARAQTVADAASRIQMYRRIIARFPNHEYAPEALFMVGFIYSEELNDADLAAKSFRELINRYPSHEMVESAKWMLANMSKDAGDRAGSEAANDSL